MPISISKKFVEEHHGCKYCAFMTQLIEWHTWRNHHRKEAHRGDDSIESFEDLLVSITKNVAMYAMESAAKENKEDDKLR